MADESEEDKTEEPSAKKLSQAREEGNVPKTPELPQALSLRSPRASVLSEALISSITRRI